MKRIFLWIAIFTALMIVSLVGEVMLLLFTNVSFAYALFYVAGAAFILDVVCILIGFKRTHKK